MFSRQAKHRGFQYRVNQVADLVRRYGRLHYREVAVMLGLSPRYTMEIMMCIPHAFASFEYRDGYLIHTDRESRLVAEVR